MNPEIYREYDIRGVIGEDIKEDEFITMASAPTSEAWGKRESSLQGTAG